MAGKTRQQPRQTLPYDSDELLELCKQAKFTIGRSTPRGVIVSNPKTNESTLITKAVRPGTKGRNLHLQLVRIGLLDELADAEAEREETRRARIDDDRAAAEAAIAEADASADAANKVVRHVIHFTPPALASTNGASNGSTPSPAAMPKRTQNAPPARTVPKPVPAPFSSEPNKADGPPEMYVQRVLVTPEMALEWLTRAESTLPDGTKILQRGRRPAHVKELARAMENGDWLLTPQGIALAPEAPWNTGAVLDGQHRLEAVMEYGKPVEFMVTFNVDPATFKVLDTGKARSGADVLTSMGKKSTLHLSSTAKLYVVWEMWQQAPDALADWRNWARIKVSNIEMAEAVERFPALDQAMNDARALTGAPWNFNLPAATVFRIWVGNVWPAGTTVLPGQELCPIDAWLEKIRRAKGLGLRRDTNGDLVDWDDDPRMTLRNWSQEAKKLTRLYPGMVREASLLAIVRAWNYYLKDRGMKYVHIKTTDLMPIPLPGPLPE
jgi:hypothetical protein